MKKYTSAILWSLFIGLLGNTLALAAGDIVLRSTVMPERAWVGQKVVLNIDVLAKDGWAQLPKGVDLEVAGAYLLDLESQGTRLGETIDGDAYTGQRYSFMLFAQREGEFAVPAVPVDVAITTWGVNGGTRIVRAKLPAAEFIARTPPGAEHVAALVSSVSLTANQSWEPETQTAMVGDAIKRSIVLRAKDVSGMAFSPTVFDAMDDIGVYPGEPSVEDQFDRGDFGGERVETVTYVFERAGRFEIPAVEITWWNTTAEELQHIVLPGLALEVTGELLAETAVSTKELQQSDRRTLWVALGVTALAMILLMFSVGRLVPVWRAWRKAEDESEAAYFRRIRRAVRSGDAAGVLRDTMRWLDRINDQSLPARLDSFLCRYGDAGEQAAVVGAGKSGTRKFFRNLAVARKHWRKTQADEKRADDLLPNLNG